MTRIAVAGRGSAATRTLKLLREIGNSQITHVTSQPMGGFGNFQKTSVESLRSFEFDWVIDCSPASTRVANAKLLSDEGLPTFFEKPLAMDAKSGGLVLDSYAERGVPIQVGYNLRRLKAFDFVRDVLASSSLGSLNMAVISVGQYLPDWRPNRDYQSTVSAQAALGGGVLLELSHEINYAIGLWGNVEKVTGVLRNSGELEIDSEDLAHGTLVFESGSKPVEVHITLDFLRRTPERWCQISGQKAELLWDLLKNEVTISTSSQSSVHSFDDSIDDTYRNQIAEMISSERNGSSVAKENADALHTLEVIDAWRVSSELGGCVGVREESACD